LIQKEDLEVSDRVYEILFIADPNLGEPEVDALTALVQGYAEKEGGRIQKVEKWGKKRLAYLIGKHREGSYVLLVVEGTGNLVKEVERRIRVTDGVIRFLTVRVDEELRKAEGRRSRRAGDEEKKRTRQPSQTIPVPVEGVQE
jgi:small subunit ribosomal protein S6